MNWRTVLVGLAGGALVSAVLEYPLHRFLPSGWVKGWPSASVWVALILVVAAVLLLVACGVLAGRLSPAASRRQAAVVGAMAGLIAALLAEAWIGGAAAGVWGSRAVISHGLSPAQDDNEFLGLLLDGTVETLVWVYLSIWIALIAGIGFGALGGAVVGKGVFSLDATPLFRPAAIFLGILVSTAATIATLVTFTILGPTVMEVAAKIGYRLAYSETIVLYFPTATSFLLLLAWQLYGLRIFRPHPGMNASDQAILPFAALASVGLPLGAGILCMLFLGTRFFTVPVVVGILLSLFVGVLTMLLGRFWRTTTQISADPQPPIAQTPGVRLFAAIVWQGIIITLLFGGLGLLTYALSVSHLDIAMINILLPLTEKTSLANSAALPMSISALVDAQYSLQREALLYLFPAAIVLSLLAASLTMLVFSRIQSGGEIKTRTWVVRGLISSLLVIALLFIILFGVLVIPIYRLTTLGGL